MMIGASRTFFDVLVFAFGGPHYSACNNVECGGQFKGAPTHKQEFGRTVPTCKDQFQPDPIESGRVSEDAKDG